MRRSCTGLALPRIKGAACTGCGLCEQPCPTSAVVVHGNLALIVRQEACTFCEVCEDYCPAGAIERLFTITFAPVEGRDIAPGGKGTEAGRHRWAGGGVLDEARARRHHATRWGFDKE